MRRAKDSARLISTGITGLDTVLMGGLVRHNVVLLQGGPGTGKSILGWQFIHQGATVTQEPGLLISFELAPAKLMANALQFGWDFEKLAASNKIHAIFTTPAVLGEEMQSPDGILADEIAQVGAKRIFIDGLSPLRGFSERYSGRPFRESLYRLLESLQRFGVTIMLTHETIDPLGMECLDERFMCDTILRLACEPMDRHQHRTLQVVKSRGQPCIEGRHTLRIQGGQGICVYPRAAPRGHLLAKPPTVRQSVPTGICGLDAYLGGGLVGGSQCLILGPTGTGKSLLGLHFLRANAAVGRYGIWLSCQSPATEVHRLTEDAGMGCLLHDEQIVAPKEAAEPAIDLDIHFDTLCRRLESHSECCVVVDGIERYLRLRGGEGKAFLQAVESLLRWAGATGLYTQSGDSSYEGWQKLGAGMPLNHADYIALLRLQHTGSWLRTVTWPKVRGMPSVAPVPFALQDGVLKVLDKFGSGFEMGFSSYGAFLQANDPEAADARKSAFCEATGPAASASGTLSPTMSNPRG